MVFLFLSVDSFPYPTMPYVYLDLRFHRATCDDLLSPGLSFKSSVFWSIKAIDVNYSYLESEVICGSGIFFNSFKKIRSWLSLNFYQPKDARLVFLFVLFGCFIVQNKTPIKPYSV